MNIVRALYGCLLGSAGILLISGTALATADVDVSPLENIDVCATQEVCVDQYLWSLYDRTPKIDNGTVSEQRKVTVKHKGKTRIVTKTFFKSVDEDFAWKDPAAAQKAGMSLMEYVIGGMDPTFKLTLYRAFRAMDDAGLAPGITSAFRDDYRQSIATGRKARNEDSYHGGSRRGGYGHGLAVDLVSVNGATHAERLISSRELWKWIDANGKDLGIGRPYLDRDPPHVAPIDGKEYVDHRGGANTQQAALKSEHTVLKTKHALLEAKRHHRIARHNGRRMAKKARTAGFPRGRSG
jgi:hypothetical protein